MIHHVVQFTWKAEATPAQIEAAGNALVAMNGRIPEIRDVRFGVNLTEEATPYTHVLIVTFDDFDGVRRYIPHPVHQETIRAFIRPIMAGKLAADVDVGSTPIVG